MKGFVYNNEILAGILEKTDAGEYLFTYDDEYLKDNKNPAISLTLPKTQKQLKSDFLFPFFSGLLSEGVNKEIQCRLLKLDENDEFNRLIQTAGTDTIGAITIKSVEK